MLLAAVALPATQGCSSPAQSQTAPPRPKVETKRVPPTPIAIKKVELDGHDPWNPAWSRMIERAMPRRMLSRRRARAVAPLCPRYRTMTMADRRAFWAYFFQALAGAEAGLKPTADVRHSEPQVAVIDPVTHRIVRQEGLLQLAYEDSLRYGCNFDWKKDKDLPEHDPAKTILEPRNNLLCGIRILDRQMLKEHKPLLSNSSYWVTLHPDSPSFRIFLRQMANVPAACGSPLRHPVTGGDGLPPVDEAERTKLSPPVQRAADVETPSGTHSGLRTGSAADPPSDRPSPP